MFSSELTLPRGPTPQAVTSKRWCWNIYAFLLGVTFVFRLISLDIAGALLSGMMLCFAVVMLRDGMREIGKYALAYSVLCSLNFCFDVLPLISAIHGRVHKQQELVSNGDNSMVSSSSADAYIHDIFKNVNGVRNASEHFNGWRSRGTHTYILRTTTTPFFDSRQSLMYNVQSFSMILSPLVMLIGVALSVHAHKAMTHAFAQRPSDGTWDELTAPSDDSAREDDRNAQLVQVPLARRSMLHGDVPVGQHSGEDAGRPSRTAQTTNAICGGDEGSSDRFHGHAHKLG